jgi:hypothetical protein
MTLPALEERYFPYLADHPPVHLLVAAYLGVKSPRHERPAVAAQDLRAIRSELPAGTFAERNVHEGLGEVVLDFEELKRRAGGA